MKILIAPDSYKECLSALRVAECMRDGLALSVDAEMILRPMADGGEGTVDALVYSLNGKRCTINTVDMYHRPLQTYYGAIDDATAVIEVANIIGMEVTRERNPYVASSYGVGDVIKQLTLLGYQKIYIGLGGSLTNDGGAGMLEALGLSFYDAKGALLQVSGGNLSEITRIEGTFIPLQDVEIHLISDVTNPLTGPYGATYTYGKQKGISDSKMQVFDAGLKHFQAVLNQYLNQDYSDTKGAGAAGGIGYGLLNIGGLMHNGAEWLSDIVLKDIDMSTIDYIFTGEGRTDFQTAFGKLPACIAQRGKAYGAKSILVSGGLGEQYETLYDHFLSMHSIVDGPMPLEDALTNAERLLRNTCRNIGRLIVMEK
ncbi:glycerate kinase [Macrococcoides caseolyticum]|uniref:glycerate kinase n=1 Tax=Macrococcoides caseolyticum TaxID=69966 RepID=UPI001F24488F|nr:glycerate kinase [Macrococcus caseolyticus]MCE4956063.1 glycerate kinase [Macrococcus caseolyticus]